MDEGFKKRGINHLKNKLKYKNRNKAIPQPRTVQRPVLESNWHRYESDTDDSDSENLKSFDILSNAPLSQAGRFQFKSDKKALEDETYLDPYGIFDVDLNELNAALNCIPFNERHDLKSEYFTEEELQHMKNKANSNLKSLKLPESSQGLLDVLKGCLTDEPLPNVDVIKRAEENTSVKIKQQENTSFEDMLEDLNIDDEEFVVKEKLTNKSSHTITQPISDISDVKVEKKVESDILEEWLDDLLDK